MVRIAMTDMMLNDDGHTNIRNQDALLSFDNYPDITALGDDGEPAVFDVVLTNPPFGSIMKQETLEMLGRFDLGHKRKSLPLEVLGLERSIQFLKPGGRLAIVLPEHLTKGKSGAFVREWLGRSAHLLGIFFFPEEAFTPYGAMVKTCLCVFQKRRADDQDMEDPVFLCEVENLGYDATGRAKPGSEVAAAAAAFREHVGWQVEDRKARKAGAGGSR
jgi:type I restriction enzyme M protein